MKKFILSILVLILISVIFLSLRPVSADRNNSTTVTGVITKVSEGGTKDAVFYLEGSNISYYINRALENGFNLIDLNKDLVGKNATIMLANTWTPLDPFGHASSHIVELKSGEEVIYSEFK